MFPSFLQTSLPSPPSPPLTRQYLNPASLHDPNLQDEEEFSHLTHSMDCIGLSPSEKADLFRVVAAVLHLGNVSFEENTKDKKGVLGGVFWYDQLHNIGYTGHKWKYEWSDWSIWICRHVLGAVFDMIKTHCIWHCHTPNAVFVHLNCTTARGSPTLHTVLKFTHNFWYYGMEVSPSTDVHIILMYRWQCG